ncbi:hypothetical protein [Aquisalimonas asiatica]|uniref:Acyl dehydratase n=1 Tax=Aquisalimonas asiatica TaxID=406100 RepID=A0A1H8V3J1_9GAMM|nr:hypothetical protein [Aquisalimonas asiatica]SEP09783.1 Acyl dehydratase [Aquisalimonas asiatica]
MSAVLDAFHRLAVGDTASLVRTYSAEDVRQWAALARAPEPADGVPEPLLAGLFSCLLGETLPGHGTNYLKQHLEVVSPAQVGEAITARVVITRLRPDKALVNLDTECTGVDGRVVCRGDALVLFKR